MNKKFEAMKFQVNIDFRFDENISEDDAHAIVANVYQALRRQYDMAGIMPDEPSNDASIIDIHLSSTLTKPVEFPLL